MLLLSQVMIANQDLQDFDELKAIIKEFAARGEIHLRFDVKPQFPDTPNDWEDQLEAAFSSLY